MWFVCFLHETHLKVLCHFPPLKCPCILLRHSVLQLSSTGASSLEGMSRLKYNVEIHELALTSWFGYWKQASHSSTQLCTS